MAWPPNIAKCWVTVVQLQNYGSHRSSSPLLNIFLLWRHSGGGEGANPSFTKFNMLTVKFSGLRGTWPNAPPLKYATL